MVSLMKKLALLTALALVGMSSATLRADNPRTYERGFLYNITNGDLSDVVYNYSETYLSGISSNWVIGNAGNDWSNPLSSNIGFLTNVIKHESRVINVPGSIGGSHLDAIGGNIVAGNYYYGGTNVVRNFLYNISNGTYTTNITFTNSYPWATNACFQYTSEAYAVSSSYVESNSYTTNFDTYHSTYTTNYGKSDIILYKISNGSNTLVKYPTNSSGYNINCYSWGISSNIVVGTFWGSINSRITTNRDGDTNGSFYYNADTRVYRELPPINGNTPYASAISGDVILGSWSESVEVSSNSWSQSYYLFKYSTASNSYISTNITPVTGAGQYGNPSQINAFEGNRVVGITSKGTNWSDGRAYLYDMSKPINNDNPIDMSKPINNDNPIVADQPYSYATGISGDYVIGGYYSTNPIVAPSPVVSSGGGGGGGGSVSKKKSAKKSSVKKATAKKATKKKSATKRK
jgi:hypothetical protein